MYIIQIVKTVLQQGGLNLYIKSIHIFLYILKLYLLLSKWEIYLLVPM